MARKEKKLTSAEYWEWRCNIEEIKFCKLNEKRVHLEKELMNRELENKKLRLALFKETVKAARKSVETSEAEYEKFKQSLEKKLGMSLSDCVIDPHTFEVNKLEN